MAYRRYAWAEVDLGAVRANVRELKALTAPGTRFMAVVKADGYGHGAPQAAQAALHAGADRLGVATVEEAVELRRSGIAAPLHLLSEPPPSAAPLVVEHALLTALATRDFAVALSEAAVAAGRRASFHLKLDTGMNRIGVRAEDAVAFVESLRGLPGIAMEGTFTHFATADVPGDWEFDRQLERFGASVAALRSAGFDPGVVHAANSAATILHPESHFDMVRCGIAVYGLHPAPSTRGAVGLSPALAVKARVSFVKRVGMGEGVSYGFAYHAGSPVTVATLPLGYADGVHRVLSNRMRVLLRGTECRQIGRVCMDQLVVEVPGGLQVRVGDEAVLVGEQDGVRLTLDDLAEEAGTINYEMACAFGMRLEKFFA